MRACAGSCVSEKRAPTDSHRTGAKVRNRNVLTARLELALSRPSTWCLCRIGLREPGAPPRSRTGPSTLRGSTCRRSERRGTPRATRTLTCTRFERVASAFGLAGHTYWPRDSNSHWRRPERRASAIWARPAWRGRESNPLDTPCESGPAPCLSSPCRRSREGVAPVPSLAARESPRGAEVSRTPRCVHAMHVP